MLSTGWNWAWHWREWWSHCTRFTGRWLWVRVSWNGTSRCKTDSNVPESEYGEWILYVQGLPAHGSLGQQARYRVTNSPRFFQKIQFGPKISHWSKHTIIGTYLWLPYNTVTWVVWNGRFLFCYMAYVNCLTFFQRYVLYTVWGGAYRYLSLPAHTTLYRSSLDSPIFCTSIIIYVHV